MTIALAVKVNDGLVLASDSATTLMIQNGGASTVNNIYNNANKVFNLYKGLPIGAMTWGLGGLGPASIATLAKDLRRRFMGNDPSHLDWKIDPNNYSVEDVAARARQFLYDERYQLLEQRLADQGQAAPALGFLVTGYSSGADEPTAYVIALGEGGHDSLIQVLQDDGSAAWWGQPDAIARLLNGMSVEFPRALSNLGLVSSDDDAWTVYDNLRPQLNPQMVNPAMPIQDAVDLAEFLVHTTIQFVRFSPGHPTVGGPIEIATITKHEDFKWVQRKHFFETRLNPLNGAS